MVANFSGLQVGEHILKHTGIEVIRTAGGKLVQVRGAVLNSKQARELGVDYILADLQYQQKNILYEPLSQAVQRLVKSSNIKVLILRLFLLLWRLLYPNEESIGFKNSSSLSNSGNICPDFWSATESRNAFDSSQRDEILAMISDSWEGSLKPLLEERDIR